jgi:hypothetical protein
LLNFNAATVSLDDPLAQVQTQSVTRAVASCGVELYKGLEYFFGKFCGDSLAVIINNDLNPTTSIEQTDFDRLAVGQ